MFASQTCIMDRFMDEPQTLTFATVTARCNAFIDTFSLLEQLDLQERIDVYLKAFDPAEWAEQLDRWLNLDPEYQRLAQRMGWQ